MAMLAGLNRTSIAVDSNLLLLLVVGSWNPRFIETYKRLSDYSVQDFYLVRDFVSSFETIAVTAHVLTEVSNLAGGATGKSREAIFRHFARTIATVEENLIPSRTASACSEFVPFGLTDAALSVLCLNIPLLTGDGRLAAHLQRRGLEVLTLESLKTLRDQANYVR